ncbi:MAG: LOG family protein [Mariprofundaceae bacterium]
MKRRQITAFGASRLDEKDPIYHDVVALGQRLAKSGWNGMTGGHQGLMAAFSQGIHQGGGHMRGVTLECFPTPPNNLFIEEQRAHNFFERMQTLIEDSDAWIVLPGGLGTLAELAMTWDLLAIEVLKMRPLILYGDMWREIMKELQTHLLTSTNHSFTMVHYCTTIDEVMEALETIH